MHECTKAEWKILELLWKQNGLTSGQLQQFLEKECGWTQHAVSTLLNRMLKKRLIELDESDSPERYVCRMTRSEIRIAKLPAELTLRERLQSACRLAKGGKYQ